MSKSDKSLKTGQHFKPAKPQGPHKTGKANGPTASRRDSHPGKAEKAKYHADLIADQRISGFDTGTLGEGSFPVHSTGGRKEGTAVRKQNSDSDGNLAVIPKTHKK